MQNYVSRMRSEDTYNSRSAETIAKQEKAKQDKLLAEERIKELKAQMDEIIGSGLADKILISFNNNGVEKTLQDFDKQF